MNKKLKYLIITILSIIIFATAMPALLYLYVLPKAVSRIATSDELKKFVKTEYNVDFTVKNPVLKTHFKPDLVFKTGSLTIKQNQDLLLDLNNFDCEISLAQLFSKKIILKKIGADDIYIDINKLKNIKIKQQKKEKETKQMFKIDYFNAFFYIKHLTILYTSKNNVKMKLLSRNIEISDKNNAKFLHFGIFLDILHKKQHLKLFFLDRDTIYLKNKKLHIDNFRFKVNNSEITVKGFLDENNKYDFTFFTNKFELENVRKILDTNLVIPNGSDFISYFKDFGGDFNFRLNLKPQNISGNIKVNKVRTKLIPLADIPLCVTKGVISFDNKDIILKDFTGFYETDTKNVLKMDGTIKDYVKTVDTLISIKGIMTNDFAKYISKLSGINIKIKNKAGVKTDISYKNNKLSVVGKAKVPKGSDVLFEGLSISPENYARYFDVVMDFVRDELFIKNLNYYIETPEKPIITLNSCVNIFTGAVKELDLYVPQPLPSEFFNILIGQNLFRNGTFSGNIRMVNNETPYLDGKLSLKDTFIAGQMTMIKNLTLTASKNTPVKIVSDGVIRRARYSLNTEIANKMVFPVVVSKGNFTIADLDVERIMKTFAPRHQTPVNRKHTMGKRPVLSRSNISKEYFKVAEKTQKKETSENSGFVFLPNLIEIKNTTLNVEKGHYKDINLGNLHANMTLSPDGVLNIKSNKFDFADGISTLKVYCDFAKNKYAVRLGAKEVNTDLLSTVILNLPKEISGKANALLEFYTDEKMKLNGKIQFAINDGLIAKLGLVQYLLNVASIFRNPLVTITPSSFFNIVNIPDGSFKKINGSLVIRNNIIERLMIKSSSKNLSSFVIGRINLMTMDTTLNVYTKFSERQNRFWGKLRNLSLNAIAQKATSYTKLQSASYYESEIAHLPKLESGEETANIYLTKIDGNIQTSNYISSVKKIK